MGAYGTSACVPRSVCADGNPEGFVGKLWKTGKLAQNGEEYSTTACSTAILIRKMIVDPDTSYVWGGYVYRTIQNFWRGVYDQDCDRDEFSPLPAEYELSPDTDDIYQNVIARFPWNVRRLVTASGNAVGTKACNAYSSCAYSTKTNTHENVENNGFVGQIHKTDRLIEQDMPDGSHAFAPKHYRTENCSMGVFIRTMFDDLPCNFGPGAEQIECMNGGVARGVTGECYCECPQGFGGDDC